MIREDRYLVVKRSDISRHLVASSAQILYRMAEQVANGRRREGKPALQCVVVESDWPEYEIVWDLIESRVDGTSPMVLTYAQHEEAMQGLREERDDRDGVIDQILNLVLGADRTPWSSDYGLASAVADVAARVAAQYVAPISEAEQDGSPMFPAIFCFSDDNGDLYALTVRNRAELLDAVTRWVFDWDSMRTYARLTEEEADAAHEITGIADTLLEGGAFRPEGDKPCFLRRA